MRFVREGTGVESQNCLISMALVVVVTIVVVTLLILLRDVVRFFLKKTQVRASSQRPLPRPDVKDSAR